MRCEGKKNIRTSALSPTAHRGSSAAEKGEEGDTFFARTTNEGLAIIQYKFWDLIYVFPKMKLPDLIIFKRESSCSVSQFPHSCICERFIYSQGRSAYFASAIWAVREIYKLLTDT
jgi:hypothetical protein